MLVCNNSYRSLINQVLINIHVRGMRYQKPNPCWVFYPSLNTLMFSKLKQYDSHYFGLYTTTNSAKLVVHITIKCSTTQIFSKIQWIVQEDVSNIRQCFDIHLMWRSIAFLLNNKYIKCVVFRHVSCFKHVGRMFYQILKLLTPKEHEVDDISQTCCKLRLEDLNQI